MMRPTQMILKKSASSSSGAGGNKKKKKSTTGASRKQAPLQRSQSSSVSNFMKPTASSRRMSAMAADDSSSPAASGGGVRKLGMSREAIQARRRASQATSSQHGTIDVRRMQQVRNAAPRVQLILTPDCDPFSPDSMFEVKDVDNNNNDNDNNNSNSNNTNNAHSNFEYLHERNEALYESKFAVFRYMLMEGAILMKLDDGDRPRGKFFCLNIVGNLHWHDMPLDSRDVLPSPNYIRVRDVKKILTGKHTPAFSSQGASTIPEELCFSVVTDEVTLDLRARNPRMRDMWVRALTLVHRQCLGGMVDMITGESGIDTLVYEMDSAKLDALLAGAGTAPQKPRKHREEAKSTPPPTTKVSAAEAAAKARAKRQQEEEEKLMAVPDHDQEKDEDGVAAVVKPVIEPEPDSERRAARASYPSRPGGQQNNNNNNNAVAAGNGATSAATASGATNNAAGGVARSTSNTSKVSDTPSEVKSDQSAQMDTLNSALNLHNFKSDKELIRAVAKPRAFLRFVADDTPSICFVRLTQSHIYFGPSADEVDANSYPLSDIVTVGAGKITSTFQASDDELTPPECCLSVVAEKWELNLQLDSKKKRNKWVAAVATLVSLHV